MGSPLRSRALDSGAVNKTKLVLGSCHSYLGIGNRNAFVVEVEQTIFRGSVFAFLSPAKNLVGGVDVDVVNPSRAKSSG